VISPDAMARRSDMTLKLRSSEYALSRIRCCATLGDFLGVDGWKKPPETRARQSVSHF
jgi:hypothetical protein